MQRINERVVMKAMRLSAKATDGSACDSHQGQDNDEADPPKPSNQGQLIVDASCAPADSRYPTDLSLLKQAREQTEISIDVLYEQVQGPLEKKPRTYRQQARQDYLKVDKQRKARGHTMRKAIRQQLGYVKRKLAHLDALVSAGAS